MPDILKVKRARKSFVEKVAEVDSKLARARAEVDKLETIRRDMILAHKSKLAEQAAAIAGLEA